MTTVLEISSIAFLLILGIAYLSFIMEWLSKNLVKNLFKLVLIIGFAIYAYYNADVNEGFKSLMEIVGILSSFLIINYLVDCGLGESSPKHKSLD